MAKYNRFDHNRHRRPSQRSRSTFSVQSVRRLSMRPSARHPLILGVSTARPGPDHLESSLWDVRYFFTWTLLLANLPPRPVFN